MRDGVALCMLASGELLAQQRGRTLVLRLQQSSKVVKPRSKKASTAQQRGRTLVLRLQQSSKVVKPCSSES